MGAKESSEAGAADKEEHIDKAKGDKAMSTVPKSLSRSRDRPVPAEFRGLPPCWEYREGKEGMYYCDGYCYDGRTVFGHGPYSADSSACRAARHAGVLPPGRDRSTTHAEGTTPPVAASAGADSFGGPGYEGSDDVPLTGGTFRVVCERGQEQYGGCFQNGVRSYGCGAYKTSIRIERGKGKS